MTTCHLLAPKLNFASNDKRRIQVVICSVPDHVSSWHIGRQIIRNPHIFGIEMSTRINQCWLLRYELKYAIWGRIRIEKYPIYSTLQRATQKRIESKTTKFRSEYSIYKTGLWIRWTKEHIILTAKNSHKLNSNWNHGFREHPKVNSMGVYFCPGSDSKQRLVQL